jgi:hypothetical protein
MNNTLLNNQWVIEYREEIKTFWNLMKMKTHQNLWEIAKAVLIANL